MLGLIEESNVEANDTCKGVYEADIMGDAMIELGMTSLPEA
jgi:hypothetical protein